MDGVFVVNKPAGWTSHDVVNRMRRLARDRRVGHLGTLDPLATGVLPLVVGRATRLSQFYLKNDKTYDAVVRFGWSTDTYDRDGAPTSEPKEVELSKERLEEALERFQGTFTQVPPPVSAKKIGGVPAYRLARKKKPVELAPVTVTVRSLELREWSKERARLVITCGAGTYLRSIAHDLGQMLGCGAFLEELVRTRSGEFTLEQAKTLDELAALGEAGRLEEALIPMRELLKEFPAERVDAVTAEFIRQGRDFRTSPFSRRGFARYVRAISPEGDLIAIGEARQPNLYHPMLVL